MDARHRLLDRMADRKIGGAGIFGVDAALQAHFGGAALPGFLDAADDLVHIEVVGPAAQVLAELALREGAELAAEIADVGVVDVAGDDIGDRVARDLAAQPVGGLAHRGELVAARREQANDVGFGKRFAGASRGRGYCGFRPLTRPARFALGHPSPAPRRWVWRRRAGAGDPGVGARQALRVDRAQYRRAQSGIEPARRVLRVGRVDREPLDEQLAGRGGAPREEIEGRPRRFGVDVVGGHRRHPAPIVDPGRDHRFERVRHQVGRRLDVHRRGPKINRAIAIVHRWSARSGSAADAMRVRGLARKFWMMISWMCP